MIKYTFQNQCLHVDYIRFSFEESGFYKLKIANYLLTLGFNSHQVNKDQKYLSTILENSTNQFTAKYISKRSKKNWIYVDLTENNGARFYFLCKQKKVDWTIFSEAHITRFDVNYLRKNKDSDKISIRRFLNECAQKLQKTHTNVGLDKNNQGFVLRIGNRKSNHCSRIYQRQNSLRFELEIKGKTLQNYHNLLVQNSFQEFEQKMSSNFIIYFGKLLSLQYSYTDWLVEKLRPLRQQRFDLPSLNSD